MKTKEIIRDRTLDMDMHSQEDAFLRDLEYAGLTGPMMREAVDLGLGPIIVDLIKNRCLTGKLSIDDRCYPYDFLLLGLR